MARYENLPIYRKGLELSIYLETVVRNFSRYNKYTLGEWMRSLALEVLTMTIRANSERDRVKTLEELMFPQRHAHAGGPDHRDVALR